MGSDSRRNGSYSALREETKESNGWKYEKGVPDEDSVVSVSDARSNWEKFIDYLTW